MDSFSNYFWEYPNLVEYLNENPEEKNDVKKNFDEIHGVFNQSLVQKVSLLFDKTLRKLYDQINLELPYDFDLDELQKKHHIVLVPNHQSHADYVALTYLFYKTFKKPLYVAAGINLNIFLFGKLFKNSGAFFLRRSFAGNPTYKVSFHAYIFALLKNENIVEFFFEGGRSRTGKLLSPRYGLFQMLLETHQHVNTGKTLLFIPVSIAHEFVPEESAHSSELKGAKKKKEHISQVLKIYKLFNKRLGSIHVTLGQGIEVRGYDNLRASTQKLAFSCFKSVGKGMPITPTSLLSLILLDTPSGINNWELIEFKAKEIIAYCKRFSIPLTPSLSSEFDVSKNNILEALNILISNKKVNVIKNQHLGDIYYSVKPKERVHLLYFKNMILHHFILPVMLNTVIYYLKEKKFKTVEDLRSYLIDKRSELLFEFYLPSTAEMLQELLDTISYATGKNIEKLDEVLDLNDQELDQVATKIRVFSSSLSYISECYYIAARTLDHLAEVEFNQDSFIQTFKEVFGLELDHGRIIQFQESFSITMVKSALQLYQHKGCTELVGDIYKVVDLDQVFKLKKRFAENLNINLIMNLSLNTDDF